MDEEDFKHWFLLLAVHYLSANFIMIGALHAGGERAALWMFGLVAAMSSCLLGELSP